MVEKTEDVCPVLTKKGRSNPGAPTPARMWGRSTGTDMTFLGGRMLVCERSHFTTWRIRQLHFGFLAGFVDCLVLSEQTGKPIHTRLRSQRGWRASPLLLPREVSSVARPPTWGNEISKWLLSSVSITVKLTMDVKRESAVPAARPEPAP